MARIIVGGVIGGIVVFAWGAAAHMVLPLGQTGLKQLPHEPPVLDTMRGFIKEPGLYFFPGMDMSKKMSPEEETAYAAKYKQGPTGLLLVDPTSGREMMTPLQLIAQVVSDVAAALIAAVVLSRVAGGYGARLFTVTLLGLFAWLVISVPYWNWYRFPTDFTIAAGIEQVAGWFLGGLLLAAIVRRKPTAPAY